MTSPCSRASLKHPRHVYLHAWTTPKKTLQHIDIDSHWLRLFQICHQHVAFTKCVSWANAWVRGDTLYLWRLASCPKKILRARKSFGKPLCVGVLDSLVQSAVCWLVSPEKLPLQAMQRTQYTWTAPHTSSKIPEKETALRPVMSWFTLRKREQADSRGGAYHCRKTAHL